MINQRQLDGRWLGRYVAKGAGMPYSGRVLPANGKAPTPANLFATILMMRSEQRGTNSHGPMQDVGGWSSMRHYDIGHVLQEGGEYFRAIVEYDDVDPNWQFAVHRWEKVGKHYRTQVVSTRDDTYSIQFFREGAAAAAQRLRLWTSSPEGRLEMERMGWDEDAEKRVFTATFLRCSDVRRLDAVTPGEWEQRAGLDISIRIVDYQTQYFPAVGTVDFTARSGETAESGQIQAE